MKLLANENFPLIAVEALRDAGHDVLWARESMPGDDDERILHRAQGERRIVITFDTDFGELAFHWGLPADSGVILFRLALQSPELVRRRTVEAIEARTGWAGHFAVVEENRTRLRPLRRAKSHDPTDPEDSAPA